MIIHGLGAHFLCFSRGATRRVDLLLKSFDDENRRRIFFDRFRGGIISRHLTWTNRLLKEECCENCPKERKEVCQTTAVTVKHSGMKMPAVILGTCKLNDLKVANKALGTAFKVGYRAIDTSPSYGNEEVIGCSLPAALEEAKLKREDIFIISKLPFDSMRCEKVSESIGKTLKNLETPYVDLFVISFPAGSVKNDKGVYEPDSRVNHKCIWKSMEAAVECNQAKYLGVANFNCNQLEELIDKSKVKPSNIQIEMTPYFQQKTYRRVAKELCVSVTAYGPFGISPDLAATLKKGGFKEDENACSVLEEPCITSIAEKLCKTPHQVILRFFLQLDDNLAVITGGCNPKNICDNFSVFDVHLDEADMTTLKNLDKGKKARLFNKNVFKILYPGVDKHEMFPWKDC